MLLACGGHAHPRVLAELARTPLRGWQVDLVSPQEHQIYSGMLPGWIAGHHPLQACLVPLRPLAQRAGISFHRTAGAFLDASRNSLRCENGESLGFDALSLDIGPVPALDGLAVDSADVLPIRPLEGLVDAWPRLMERIGGQCRPFHLVIVGGGAGGLELAFAVRHRDMCEGWSHLKVTLVGTDARPLAPSHGAIALGVAAPRTLAAGDTRDRGLTPTVSLPQRDRADCCRTAAGTGLSKL